MRYLSVVMIVVFIALAGITKSQTPLYEEDFETAPVTSVVNSFTDSVPNGPSPCSQASRGTTADFNSTNVDFKNSQNSTYFLGVNPEDPCGGYYGATLESDTFDFSSADSLYFSCRYFIGDSLGWGTALLDITFKTTTASFTIDSQFTDTSDWANVSVRMPDALIDDSVWFTINMGGGEGIALDDLEVTDVPTSTTVRSNVAAQPLLLYPNPVSDHFYIKNPSARGAFRVTMFDVNGEKVLEKRCSTRSEQLFTIHNLPDGVYVLEIISEGEAPVYHKIVKQ